MPEHCINKDDKAPNRILCGIPGREETKYVIVEVSKSHRYVAWSLLYKRPIHPPFVVEYSNSKYKVCKRGGR